MQQDDLELVFYQNDHEHNEPELNTHGLERTVLRMKLERLSGIRDAHLLDALIDVGVTPSTLTAMRLVPLIEVAWADGHIAEAEREAVLQAAQQSGIASDMASYRLLARWLLQRPDERLRQAWGAYMKSVTNGLSVKELSVLRTDILGLATTVAKAAGGFLGIGAISIEEKRTLQEYSEIFEALQQGKYS